MILTEDRFMTHVSPEPMSGCWLWTACDDGNGYGQFRFNGRMQKAHRVSYQLFRGGIPAGLHLDHKCRVRCCVNPDHLEAVTCLENITRGQTGDQQRRKTHCPKSHPYDATNTYVDKTGRRHCRKCAYIKLAARRKKRRSP